MKSKNTIVTVLLILVMCNSPAIGGSIYLSWHPNADTDLKGYNLYFGQSPRAYSPPIHVGNENKYTIDGLNDNTTYYLALTAVDNVYNESGFSTKIKVITGKTQESQTVNQAPSGSIDLPSTVLSNLNHVIDNQDSGFKIKGTWGSSTSKAGFTGNDYLYAKAGDGSHKAVWRYTIDTKAKYAIYAQWAASSNRANDAPYRIYNNGSQLDSVLMNQQVNGGQLELLGTYTLAPGTMDIVLNNMASGIVVADAIKVTNAL